MKKHSENAASKLLGISRGTLRKEAEKGNISHHIIHGKRRFSQEDIEEYKRRQYRPVRSVDNIAKNLATLQHFAHPLS